LRRIKVSIIIETFRNNRRYGKVRAGIAKKNPVMVSESRMKIDLLAQIVLTATTLLLLLVGQWVAATYPLVILVIWQALSALELFFAYHHRRRRYYLFLTAAAAALLPLWIALPYLWGYLPFALMATWYLFETAYDFSVVYRRPRSFWDL